MPAWVAAGIGLVSGVMGSSASKKAARAQAAAAQAAAAEEARQFDITRKDLAPYRETGNAALMRLADLLGIGTPEARARALGIKPPSKKDFITITPGERYFRDQGPAGRQLLTKPGKEVFDEAGYNNALAAYQARLAEIETPEDYGSLLADYEFEADPGYAFRLSEGQKLIDRRASAMGNRLSPATEKALLRFTSDLASQEYNAGFSRDLSTKQARFNMLSGVAGTGQAAVNTGAGIGAQTASNIGNYLAQAGNAQAAGSVGAANAWTSGINNSLNFFQNQRILDNYLKGPNPYANPVPGDASGPAFDYYQRNR